VVPGRAVAARRCSEARRRYRQHARRRARGVGRVDDDNRRRHGRSRRSLAGWRRVPESVGGRRDVAVRRSFRRVCSVGARCRRTDVRCRRSFRSRRGDLQRGRGSVRPERGPDGVARRCDGSGGGCNDGGGRPLRHCRGFFPPRRKGDRAARQGDRLERFLAGTERGFRPR
jgi:hypothetical protein